MIELLAWFFGQLQMPNIWFLNFHCGPARFENTATMRMCLASQLGCRLTANLEKIPLHSLLPHYLICIDSSTPKENFCTLE